MKKSIHYTAGYGGKLNFVTFCGHNIHSHSETESATIHPAQVTCQQCRSTKEWKQDYDDSLGNKKTDIKRRIFLESDVLHADEIMRAQREVAGLCEEKGVKHVRRIFSEILDYAWHDLGKTWEAVKRADEIYSDSSLMPLIGGSYTGAPVIFNGMCERAVKEKVTGKSVYILNSIKNIYWEHIDFSVMKKAFKENNLFMYDADYEKLIKIDISKLKKS